MKKMIKKINLIKNIGSFIEFKWPSTGIKEFNNNNIFYGLNGSGKTVLSQIFRYFELGKLDGNYSNDQLTENKSEVIIKTIDL